MRGVGAAAEGSGGAGGCTLPLVCGTDASVLVDAEAVSEFGTGEVSALVSTATSFISTSSFSSAVEVAGEDAATDGSARCESGEDGTGGGGIAALASLSVMIESFPSTGDETREDRLDTILAFSSTESGCRSLSACLFLRLSNNRFEPRFLRSNVSSEGGSSNSFSVCVEALL